MYNFLTFLFNNTLQMFRDGLHEREPRDAHRAAKTKRDTHASTSRRYFRVQAWHLLFILFCFKSFYCIRKDKDRSKVCSLESGSFCHEWVKANCFWCCSGQRPPLCYTPISSGGSIKSSTWDTRSIATQVRVTVLSKGPLPHLILIFLYWKVL